MPFSNCPSSPAEIFPLTLMITKFNLAPNLSQTLGYDPACALELYCCDNQCVKIYIFTILEEQLKKPTLLRKSTI